MTPKTPTNGDAFVKYFELRGKYLAQMQEHGFVDRAGKLSAAVVGTVFQPAPGGEAEWEEHCREHPNDPLCLLGAREQVRLDDLFEVREEYLDAIRDAGLEDVQRGVSDMVATTSGISHGGSVGLVAPDDPNADDIINDPRIGPLAREFAARIMY